MSPIAKCFCLLFLVLLLLGCQNQKAEIFTVQGATTTSSGIQATFTSVPTLTPEVRETQRVNTPTPTMLATQIQPTSQKLPDKEKLAQDIEAIIAQFGGRWHIVIQQIDGETLYSRQPDDRINIASVVKVPLSLLFFAALGEKGIDEDNLSAYLQSTGTGGRTFDQLLRAMLVKSEEEATKILDEYIRDSINVPTQMKEWGLSGIDLVARRYTAEGVAEIFARLYQGDFVSPAARTLLLNYLSEYTPNDDLRLGSLSTKIPESFKIYNKRGSLLTPYVVADCAILENTQGADYVIILFAYQGDPKTTYEALEQAQEAMATAIWNYINPEE
jgi:hypothetical protein